MDALEAARYIDRPAAAVERLLGLGHGARRAYFGEHETPRQSILLSYAQALRDQAREEKENQTFSTRESSPREKEKFQISGLLKSIFGGAAHLPDVAHAVESFFSELADARPRVLEGDTLTPKERIERHIRFEKTDRVGVAPCLGYHIAHAGGITVRDFMTDGARAARAARRAWDIYGGFDMLPYSFPMGYVFPFVPDSHTRFWNKWTLPECDELPKMEETPLLDSLDDVIRDGIIPLARTEAGALAHELRAMLLQAAIFGVEMARLFPRPDLYYPYAMSIINHPADLLSFWMGFEKFMMACATEPRRVREACEAIAPGLTEAGAFVANLTGAKQVLYGVSRISSSYISRKMFDDLFAGVFLSQVRQLRAGGFSITFHLDNDYTPMLDFFKELPAHCGFMHLDQTDLFKAKEALHGHLCLMGNLHPGLTAMGSPGDVEAACERLIKEVGAGGGFILSGACELPINAPVENIKAMKRAVDKWGWY